MNKIRLTDKETKQILKDLAYLNKQLKTLEKDPSSHREEIRKTAIKIQRINENLLEAYQPVINGLILQVKKSWGWIDEYNNTQYPIGFSRPEIESEAKIAFGKFVEKFDPADSKNFRQSVFTFMLSECKKGLAKTNLKIEEPNGILKYLECLQKLSHIRKQEEFNLKRFVSINEVCDRFGIDVDIVKAMMRLCDSIGEYDSLMQTNSQTGKEYLVTDTVEYSDHLNDQDDDLEYESEVTRAKWHKIGHWMQKSCKPREQAVVVLTTGNAELYSICIDELARNNPAIKSRITEIEGELLQNVTDEGLVDSLKGFFARRAEFWAKPFDALQTLLGLDNFKN